MGSTKFVVKWIFYLFTYQLMNILKKFYIDFRRIKILSFVGLTNVHVILH